MQAVILAGGSNHRIRATFGGAPKSMLPVFDVPLIEHTVRSLVRHGVTDLVLAVSGNTPEIPDYFGDGAALGCGVRYFVEYEPLGTAGVLRAMRETLEDRFIVVPGDCLAVFDPHELMAVHSAASASITMLTAAVDDPADFAVVNRTSGNTLSRVIYKPRPDETFTNEVATGVMAVEKDALGVVRADGPSDLTAHVIPRMIAQWEPVFALPINGYWADAGCLARYLGIYRDALTGGLDLVSGISNAGGIWVSDTAEVHPSVEMRPPVYVGDRTIIGCGAVLGEMSIIGENCMVESDARISGSIVCRDSVVGAGARVSASIAPVGTSVEKSSEMAFSADLERMRYPEIKPLASPERAPQRHTPSPDRIERLYVK